MARQLRIQYPGALYHIMSRGDRREDIFFNDVDRQDFIKTLAEACGKTDFQVHAFCLMSNHFHLVLETPQANLAAGMQWLLSSYTLRLNRRRALSGHVFGGRYKAILVDGSGNGYLKTVCDYVHLNPARAGLLATDERLLAYPWSSLPSYLAAPAHRPRWIRTDRLLGAHGIQQDTPAERWEFERRMEVRRRAEADDSAWEALENEWCMGSDEFKAAILEEMENKLGENHDQGQVRVAANQFSRIRCSKEISSRRSLRLMR